MDVEDFVNEFLLMHEAWQAGDRENGRVSPFPCHPRFPARLPFAGSSNEATRLLDYDNACAKMA